MAQGSPVKALVAAVIVVAGLTVLVVAALSALPGRPRPDPPAAPGPSSSASPPAGPRSGARVVAEDRAGDRRMELTIRSPALGATVRVRLLLPPGWSKDATRTWPVLWLLHGGLDDHKAWTRRTDVERLTANTGALVVMPDGGRCGGYSDWWNGGDGGPPRWETFHLTELREILERDYRAGTQRAIAGYSMGGQGAMLYAARHPGMFKAAASFSGAVHILAPGVPQAVFLGTTAGCFGTDWKRIWGDPADQREIWQQHNPYDLAGKLRGVRLYVASGDGRKKPGEWFGDGPEELAYKSAKAFANRLQELGVPVTTHFYRGRHTFSYWQTELHRAYPMLTEAIGAGRT
ncbi:alpha/beta hydrolase family protein [Sphaerisporangium flaviroseum]|uniref:Alpha/beta hydrolase family protein n=1 Tax=Sphaerisporangium flaviroseum TaxID=509199 RepID=A0ABP7HT97_9ACTN